MKFRDQFPSDKYPFSNELCAFMEAHNDARAALKASNVKRFVTLPEIFTSYTPATHKLHEDEVIGVWYIDKSDEFCKMHHKVCRFKQDFVVNVGKKDREYVVYAANMKVSKHVRPIAEFFSKYGQQGKYYHNGEVWQHHYKNISDLPNENGLKKLAEQYLAEYNQESLDDMLKQLREINDYAYSVLKESEKKLDINSIGTEAYLLGLYLSLVAHIQSLICLADSKQFRIGSHLLRPIYEMWVNSRFVYCTRSKIFVRFMVLISERQRVARAELLYSDKQISLAQLNIHQDRLNKLLKFMSKMYPKWPDNIPNALNPSKTTPTSVKKNLTLKQRCTVIDFYNQKYHRSHKKTSSMTDHYDRLYPYLSDGAHADPMELSSVFLETGDSVLATLDGSNDFEGMRRTARVAFAFEYELIDVFRRRVMHEKKPKMPSWIRANAREIGIIR